MHASTDPRLILCLEALGMSFAMLDHIQPGLHETCNKINSESQPMSLAFLKCWAFVDVVHRIRDIAQSIPGLNDKTPELKAFMESTSVALHFRNYIQHLRSELSKKEYNPFPVWGSISWVDPDEDMMVYIANSGTRIGDISSSTLIYDTHEKKWTSRVSLNIGDWSFPFDTIFDSCMQFREFIVPWILSTFKAPLTHLSQSQITPVKFSFGSRTTAQAIIPPPKNEETLDSSD